jgi:hypothetical protein
VSPRDFAVIGGAEVDAALGEWVKARTKHLTLGLTPATAVGLLNTRHEIVAAVIYENFIRDISIDVHIAIEGRMTPEFLGEIFRYPFQQLRVRRLTAKVAASNATSRRFVERLGFRLEGTIRQQLPDLEDLLIYGMLESECRWLVLGVGKHGRH